MSEPKITRASQIADIEKLQAYMSEKLGPGGPGFCTLPEQVLERLGHGVIAGYRITSDARASFIAGDPAFLLLNYGRGQFKLSLLLCPDRVELFSLDRFTCRPVELWETQDQLAHC